ncbi:ADP-ribosylglycohydrolase family protein [Marinicella gelatinilytica]|uniref:ADP-ribosylglycohydrolase family protein n=1 Tax=Marinicella gelatinilytica TaxID=2996017 RepID=UPI002260F46F|nr:ADP-ribosylglycohydrolase family protein [Marinicella gelatinilytica]MCX7545618.1 ADP-ribosylglycohydrolase family protein [Marinicella gelatinilytica]
MNNHNQNRNTLIGGLVADAASLGLHWLYDVNRIKEVTQQHNNRVAFLPVDKYNYRDEVGYFAHGHKHSGMLTHYGESLRLMINSMNDYQGEFNLASVQQHFKDSFGAGGSFQGYIDKPTAGTLKNLASGQTEPSGIEDDQLPALARLSPVILAYHAHDDFQAILKQATEITNTHSDALDYGQVYADLLTLILSGAELNTALQQVAEQAPESVRKGLKDALNSTQTDAVQYGETTGRACPLSQAMPLCFHILNNTESYQQAVETNILAGGDNAGRAIVIGTLLGAYYGIDENKGIPIVWLLRLEDGLVLWQVCDELTQQLC